MAPPRPGSACRSNLARWAVEACFQAAKLAAECLVHGIWDGLQPAELAGRRGIDVEGHAVVIWQPGTDPGAESQKKLAVAVKASGTSLTGLFGVGPFIAATVIGDAADVARFATRDHFATYNGAAPIEVSCGNRKIYRLSLRRNRRINHAIHMAAITQIRHSHSDGRAYHDKKTTEGKTHKEALGCLKRRTSDAIYARLQADVRQAAGSANAGSGGQPENDSDSSATGSHPGHQPFGQATPSPAPPYDPPPQPSEPRHQHRHRRKPAKPLTTKAKSAVDHGRRRGQLRAERVPPDPDLQLPPLGADHGRHVRPLPRVHGRGTKLNEAKLKENIDRSVMMVTALSPVIGYDKSAAISYYAIDHDQTLKQAALANGVSEELFDKVVNPIALTRPGSADIPSESGKA